MMTDMNTSTRRRLPAILLVIGLLFPQILGAAGGMTEEEIAARPPLRLEKFPVVRSTPSAALVRAMQRETARRSKLEYLGGWPGFGEDNIPKDVYPPQLQDTYQWGSIIFVFAVQPVGDEQRAEIEQYAGSGHTWADWSGVLASADRGKTWEKFFSTPVAHPDTIPDGEWCRWRYSPIGLFLAQNGRLLLDLKDYYLCGAGSGEGNFIRFATADNGRTWTWNACLYFIPEAYYRYPAGDYNRLMLSRSRSLTKLKRMNTRWESRVPLTDCPYGDWPGYWSTLPR